MNINIRPDGSINRVHVSQNDVGRTLTFNLFNDSLAYTIPVGATVKIQGTKPSGFGFSETCTVSGNTVTVDTTEAMTDEFGYIDAELQITNSGDVLGTSNFVLVVERNPHPDNTTDGTQITAQSLQVQIDELAEIIESGGITDDIKQALLDCFEHVAWIDANGQDYYDALEEALYPPANLVSISCVYTQSGTVYDTDTLDSLKSDLVVTAQWADNTTSTVTTYTLSGTLTTGTSTITVSYGGKTATFNVTVTEAPVVPLYQITSFQEKTSGSYITMTIEDYAKVTYTTTSNSRNCYVKQNGDIVQTVPSSTWFTLSQGDEYVLKVKNIAYTGSTSGSNKIKTSFANANDVGVISSGDIAFGSGTGTVQDVEITGTISDNETITSMYFTQYRASETHIDVELWVNGSRYV